MPNRLYVHVQRWISAARDPQPAGIAGGDWGGDDAVVDYGGSTTVTAMPDEAASAAGATPSIGTVMIPAVNNDVDASNRSVTVDE